MKVTEDLTPSSVDEEGIWLLSSGDGVDIRMITMEVTNRCGESIVEQNVSMVMMNTEGFIDTCPLCRTTPVDGFVVFLETHYYLGLRCCDRLLLYEQETSTGGIE